MSVLHLNGVVGRLNNVTSQPNGADSTPGSKNANRVVSSCGTLASAQRRQLSPMCFGAWKSAGGNFFLNGRAPGVVNS